MTDKQFNELKKTLEAIQKDLTSLSKNLVTTFNVVNQTAMYVGSDEGASSDSDMLQRILDAVTKK